MLASVDAFVTGLTVGFVLGILFACLVVVSCWRSLGGREMDGRDWR
jgi:hypothetical protein